MNTRFLYLITGSSQSVSIYRWEIEAKISVSVSISRFLRLRPLLYSPTSVSAMREQRAERRRHVGRRTSLDWTNERRGAHLGPQRNPTAYRPRVSGPPRTRSSILGARAVPAARGALVYRADRGASGVLGRTAPARYGRAGRGGRGAAACWCWTSLSGVGPR